MNVPEVTKWREPTGATREKSGKWEGTCHTCIYAKGICKKANQHKAHVRTPDVFCESWVQR